MAIPVARVHLKVAHAALPALLPTPPKCKMLPLLPRSCVAAILPKPPLAKPSHADADERWDACKIKPASTEPFTNSIRSNIGHGSSRRMNVTSLPPKPSRADSVERRDTHKKALNPAASSSSSAGTSVHKKRLPPQTEQFVDGESSSTGSNHIDDTEEEILWKPRALYAGPGSVVVAAPESCMLPMPTAFLVPVA